jgi:hypothetical protein
MKSLVQGSTHGNREGVGISVRMYLWIYVLSGGFCTQRSCQPLQCGSQLEQYFCKFCYNDLKTEGPDTRLYAYVVFNIECGISCVYALVSIQVDS